MLLPYQYHEREVNLLKSLLRSQPKEFDVCMIANGTPHRIAIWEELKKRGVKVNHVTGWLLPRDIEIAKCRLLLNVHVDTEQVGYVIYEHLRCDRWMFAELPIISESSKLDDEPEELGVVTPHGGKGITFVPYEKIIETVIETLAKLKQDENCDDDNNEEEKRIEMNSLISVRNEKFQKVLKKFDII